MLGSNSFKVYFLYAVGEILLIVIGILIALEINNKNEASKDKKTAKVYLENILDELKEDSIKLKRHMELNTMHIEQGDTALSYLNNEIELDDHQYIKIFMYTTYLPVFESELVTYEDMVSSGNLNLIKNHDLKTSLRKYVRRVKSLHENYIPDHIIDKRIYRKHLFKYIDARLLGTIRNKPNLDQYYIDKNGLFNDPEIKNHLRKSILVDNLLNNYYKNYLVRVSMTMRLIEDNLN